jgi:TPP-dependent indolepyruvate ferredoxin oxidoreductase alpha subunit
VPTPQRRLAKQLKQVDNIAVMDQAEQLKEHQVQSELVNNSYLSKDVGKDSQMLISEYFYNLRGKRSTALPSQSLNQKLSLGKIKKP